VRYAVTGVLLCVAFVGCGGSRVFSVAQTTATFGAHGISLHRLAVPNCPKHAPKKLSASKFDITCSVITTSNVKWKPASLPVADLVPARSPVFRYEVFVYRTAAEVSGMAARDLLSTGKDPLFGKRLDYIYRGNVVVRCVQCARATLEALRGVVKDL